MSGWFPRTNTVHGVMNGFCAADADSFHARNESRSEERLFSPQGQMPPIGSETTDADEPCVRDESRPEKHPSGSQRRIRLWSGLHPVRHGIQPAIHPHLPWRAVVVRPSPLANHACITCNTYSPAYKGKSPKKRLSPKSVNTLIHQCITFHTFLIFQYLSLWKSVFSRN